MEELVMRTRRGRREWPDAMKAEIVAQTLEPGVRVKEVADRYQISASHLSDWRRMAKDGRLVLPPLERQEPLGGFNVQSDATQQCGSHSAISTVPMSPCFVPIEIDEDAALEPVHRCEPGPSQKLRIFGWKTGFKKVGLTKLLKEQDGLSLATAKRIVDSILDGEEFSILIPDDEIVGVAQELNALNVKYSIDTENCTRPSSLLFR